MITQLSFYIKIYNKGVQVPGFHIQPQSLHDIISVSLYRSREDNVSHLIDSIRKIENSEGPVDRNVGNPGSHAIVKDGLIFISCLDNFDYEDVVLSTDEILDFLERYLEFIRAYKNMEIPGIIPTSRSGEFEIVKK